jgi:hypothetical protein
VSDVGVPPGVDRAVTVRRWIAAGVLVVLNLAALYFVAVSWLVDPNDSLGDLAAAATATIGGALALLTLPATVVPVKLRWLRAWWLAVPAVLVVLAAIRLLLVR